MFLREFKGLSKQASKTDAKIESCLKSATAENNYRTPLIISYRKGKSLNNTILHFLHMVRFNVSIAGVLLRVVHVLKRSRMRREKALAIICPGLSYTDALELSNIVSINNYIAS